jgi:peptidoglycan/xylan/chitin deacetylase (PgdA/CDA1 family)
LKEIARRGHELANHTWDHPRLNSQPHDKVFRQIQRTNNIIKELTGQTPSAFRPPYGEMNHNVRCLARSQGLETFIWTYDSRDWDNKYTLSRIMNRITKDIKAGDIILFHQDGKLTPEVIDQVIPYYQSLGLELVTLSELMDEGPYTVGEDGVVRFQKETEQ